MNSWSNTASAAKSGALFPTSGRSYCGHRDAYTHENSTCGTYHGKNKHRIQAQQTSAEARATKLRALAVLEPAAARREGLAAAPAKARGNDRHCGAPAGFGDATSAAAVDTVEAEKAHAMATVVRRGVPGRGLGSLQIDRVPEYEEAV